MTLIIVLTAFLATLAIVLLRPRRASAHCDTMAGPTAQDGLLALETGNLNHALKWIQPDGEAELREIFEKSIAARDLDPTAQEVADRWFLENLIRIHRAGEGAPFTGLRPKGAPVDERVAAADRCIEVGSLEPLAGLVSEEQLPELNRRLAEVLARKDYDTDDVAAGRAYIEAYVRFFKLAEGEGHADHHAHAAGHNGHRQ